jgi:hypothetical protein
METQAVKAAIARADELVAQLEQERAKVAALVGELRLHIGLVCDDHDITRILSNLSQAACTCGHSAASHDHRLPGCIELGCACTLTNAYSRNWQPLAPDTEETS